MQINFILYSIDNIWLCILIMKLWEFCGCDFLLSVIRKQNVLVLRESSVPNHSPLSAFLRILLYVYVCSSVSQHLLGYN